MLGDTTSIFFQTELRFLPIEGRLFGKSFVRDLYHELAKPGGHPYEDLALQSNPPTMTTKRVTPHGGTGKSVCRISSDALIIEETEPEVHVEAFIENTGTILKTAAKISKDCPPVYVQKCTIHCVAKPLSSEHSIELLAGKVSNVLDAITPFGRPPQFFGVRFRFPPVRITQKDEQEDISELPTSVEEKRDFISIRFETWSEDVEQVWMEVITTNFFQEPIEISDTEKIDFNIRQAYQFLTSECVKFLNQFDDQQNLFDEQEKEEE